MRNYGQFQELQRKGRCHLFLIGSPPQLLQDFTYKYTKKSRRLEREGGVWWIGWGFELSQFYWGREYKRRAVVGVYDNFAMSYQQNVHRLNEFVPTYVPHSDYLPNKVVDANLPEAQQWLANYEQQKRAGHVYTQRPTEFNPARYVSVRTYENVVVNQPISETEFNSRVKRV